MSHADTLRGMAKAFTMVCSHEQADTCLAGADALEAIGRVRHALDGIPRVRADSEAALDLGYDNPEWYVATADALEYALTLITEALEGETE